MSKRKKSVDNNEEFQIGLLPDEDISENNYTVEVFDIETINETVGVVHNCASLNVRDAASVFSKVICRIDQGTEVMIDMLFDHPDFYKVTLPSGIEGYCMKSYLEIKK